MARKRKPAVEAPAVTAPVDPKTLTDKEAFAFFSSIPVEDVLNIERIALARAAIIVAQLENGPGLPDTLDGFSDYYYLIHGRSLPKHGRKWVKDAYAAHEEGVGALLWAFRGGFKSTTVSETFTSFRIGQEPHKTNMVVMANDDSADKITAAITTIIEHNGYWKAVFPHVVPDKERGWGAEGYWVIDNRITREKWVEKQSDTIDPTLIGGGIGTSRLIGKHPSGVLIMDDIHDKKNSQSARMRKDVVDVVSSTLLKTTIREKGTGRLVTWLIGIGTPWEDDDAYHFMKGTGQFNFITTPVMRRAGDREPGAVYIDGKNRDGIIFNDIVGWWHLTAPNDMGVNAIISERAGGFRDFWRMFMLDLEKAKTTNLKYIAYPHDQIDTSWPKAGGCDLATVLKKEWRDNPGRDYFSLAYGTKTPMNTVVIMGGIFEQCTQAQAEEHMKTPQTIFNNWRSTLLEGDGIGEPIYTAILMRNPDLRLVMEKTGGKSKRYRQGTEMGPWLENGLVMISDADTPYLNALRKALDDFPDGNNDIRDSLYWTCRQFPETLIIPRKPDSPDEQRAKERRKRHSPVRALARA